MRDLACGPLLVRKHPQDLKGGNNAVAGRAEIAQHDVSGLLAPDIETAGPHFGDHVAISNLRPREFQIETLQIPLKTGIRHDGAHHAAASQIACLRPGTRNQRQDLVAVDQIAFFVGHDDAVRIAVERDAEIRAALSNLALHRFGEGRTAFVIDVHAVRLGPDFNDLRTKLPQNERRDLVGGAVRAIDDDSQAVQR